MKPDDRLNAVQIMTLTAASILSVDVLMVQQKIAAMARQDAWISLILGGILTFASAAVVYFLASLYPNNDFPEICLSIGGKFLGRIIILITSVYMLLYIGFSLRIFAMALRMFLMEKTPAYALVIFMALSAGYTVFKGLYTIGGIIDIIFPFTIITIFSIILLSIPQSSFEYMKPIAFHNTSGILKSIIPSYQYFAGYGVFLYYYNHTKVNKYSLVWYMAGILIPVISYVGLTVVSITVFGPKDVVTLIYPTLTLLKAIEFPATFLERLESFAAVLWIGIAYISAVLFYYASTRNIIVLFGVKSKYQKYVVWGHIPVLVIIALFIESGLLVIQYSDKAKILEVALGLFVVPLLAAVSLLKKRKGKSNET